MMKLSEIKAPAVAGVIKENTVRGAIAEIKNCLVDGADMIDLHMSCLAEPNYDTLKEIIGSTSLPVLALNYNVKYDWGNAGYTEEQRESLFLDAIKAGAAGVDIQGYTFHLPSKEGFCGEDKYSFTKGNPREIVTDEKIIDKQRKFIDKVHDLGGEVLLSCHPNIPMKCEQVVELARFLIKRNPDILKIVTIANNEEEMLESVKTMLALKHEFNLPISYHAAGKAGRLTRILNPILGGQIAFCVDRFTESSTMEQLDLKTAKTVIDNMEKIL